MTEIMKSQNPSQDPLSEALKAGITGRDPRLQYMLAQLMDGTSVTLGKQQYLPSNQDLRRLVEQVALETPDNTEK